MIQEKKRVLGRGLESLIPAARAIPPAVSTAAPTITPAVDLAPGERVQEIRLEEIEPSPYQPRRRQDEAALEELTQSIRAQGVLQPIVLRYISAVGNRPSATGATAESSTESQPPISPVADEISVGEPAHAGLRAPQVRYQLIAGERRWLACKQAGRATVPAIVRRVSNQQAMEIALIENLQREDLDCMEMAFAFDRLGREFGLTQEEMSKRTGKDRTTVSNLLRLLKLPSDVKAALMRRELSFSHGKTLMAIDDDTVLSAAAQRVIREGLSVRQTEELVNQLVWLGPASEKEDRERQRKVEDPNVKAARMDLEARLGCRVKIQDHNGKGKVVIEYKTLEDFDRILEALGR
jgi:ParB family chromosome partitioning protein